jgi:hypothetical protein
LVDVREEEEEEEEGVAICFCVVCVLVVLEDLGIEELVFVFPEITLG